MLPSAAAAVVVPAWMFDRAFCSRLTLATRRAAVGALRELRSILDEILSAKPRELSGTVPSEDPDEQKTSRARSLENAHAADGDRNPAKRSLGRVVVCALQGVHSLREGNPSGKLSLQPEALGAAHEVTK